MLKSHIHNFCSYGTSMHLNNVHIRKKSSVCVIVLTESIATYGCPSFEWFCQSVDSSNVCSTHLYTQTGFCNVWNVCVSTLHKLHMILSLSCDWPSFEWFFSSAGTFNVCQKASFGVLNHLIYKFRPTHPYTQKRFHIVWNVCVSTSYKFCMLLSLASSSTLTREAG